LDSNDCIDAVRYWLESFVVELNLCPFAKRELVKDRIRFSTTSAESLESLLTDLLLEMQLLESDPEIETTLLIHPKAMQEFADYNQFLDLVDALIEQEGYSGVFQVASFHPNYQFAETASDAAENYSNRSPYPLLHILREASVERETVNYPDVDEIDQRNIRLLRELGVAKLKTLLQQGEWRD
jgi:hypothetical protein